MNRTEQIVQESLVARIEQLTAEVKAITADRDAHRGRARALETALNNVIGSVPDNIRGHYAPVLDANREPR